MMLLSSQLPLPPNLALSAHLVRLLYFGLIVFLLTCSKNICQYLKNNIRWLLNSATLIKGKIPTTLFRPFNINIVRLVYHLHILVKVDINNMKCVKVSEASAALVKGCGNICTIHCAFRNWWDFCWGVDSNQNHQPKAAEKFFKKKGQVMANTHILFWSW